MRFTINLPISSDAKLLIKEEEKITSGSFIWESSSEKVTEIIPVSSLLKVSPSQIFKFLKKKLGEKVDYGSIIAEKKTLFSSSIIKSPIDGILKEADLKKGTLSIVSTRDERKDKFSLPIDGKIKKITKSHIEIELEGEIYHLKKGEGKDILGNLVYIAGEDVGVLDVKDDVYGCIVMVSSISEEACIKLEVIGGIGLLIERKKEDLNLPWGELSPEVFHKLKNNTGKKVWLRPREKEIIICP